MGNPDETNEARFRKRLRGDCPLLFSCGYEETKIQKRKNDLGFMALQYYGVTPMGIRFFPDSMMDSVEPEELPVPSEWLRLPEQVRKAGRLALINYYKQYWNSEGFDITDFPGASFQTEVEPMQDLQTNPEAYALVKRLAELAIAKYNEKFITGFVDVQVEKANSRERLDRSGEWSTSYITFCAQDASGAAKTFQARVDDLHDTVHLCREKPTHQLQRDLPISGAFTRYFTADELKRQRPETRTERAYYL